MAQGRRWRTWMAVAASGLVVTGLVATGVAGLSGAPPAGADSSSAQPVRMVYLPASYLTKTRAHDAKLDQDLAQLDALGINEGLFELAGFDTSGSAAVTPAQATMLARWQALAGTYDQVHGAAIQLGVVMNGRLDQGLDLDDPATRAAMVTAVDQVVALGVDDVQLDLEPYPTTAGYPALLGQLEESFEARGWTVKLSVAAPADTSTWSPSYLAQVSALVDQVDPLFYDSGKRTTVAGYEAWVEQGLAYESANTSAHAALVPVLPSYGSDPWHKPATENITTSTAALTAALAAGDRIGGAGIWWWQKFGLAKSAKFAADRAEWQAVTRSLPFST